MGQYIFTFSRVFNKRTIISFTTDFSVPLEISKAKLNIFSAVFTCYKRIYGLQTVHLSGVSFFHLKKKFPWA